MRVIFVNSDSSKTIKHVTLLDLVEPVHKYAVRNDVFKDSYVPGHKMRK